MVKEKYLPFEEPKKEPEPPKTPKERRKLKWDNFWYYHKTHVWIGAFVVLVVAVTFAFRDTSPKPDYQVGLITQTIYPQEFIESLERELEKYADDYNGDGNIRVQVNNYMLNSLGGDPQMITAHMTKFMGDAETVASIIYLSDEKNLLDYAKQGYFGYYKTGEPLPEGEEVKLEDVGWDWTQSPIATADEVLRLQKKPLYFTVRPNYGPLIEKKQDYFDKSFAFLQRIFNNQVVNQPVESDTPSASSAE